MILKWLKKLFISKPKHTFPAIGLDDEGNSYFDLTDRATAKAVMDQKIFFEGIEIEEK